MANHLLANRELINLQTARVYLGSRIRTRTPLGAAEFLMCRCPVPRGLRSPSTSLTARAAFQETRSQEDPAEMKRAYDYRVKMALDIDEIYRTVFPREYAGSPSPYLSIQREQELAQLVHRHLFPVFWSEDDRQPLPSAAVREFTEAEPGAFIPYMPVRGVQKHLWSPAYTDFAEVNLAYQVALALSRQFNEVAHDGTDTYAAWRQLNELHGLDLPEPALPLASIGWTEFLHACAVENTPLRFLPLVFEAISYKTGNPYLDMPQVGAFGFEWELRKVCELTLLWNNALEIISSIDALAAWLEEDPKERVARAYDIWNRAAAVEAQSPFAGMLPSDLIAAGAVPVSEDMEWVMMTREMRELTV